MPSVTMDTRLRGYDNSKQKRQVLRGGNQKPFYATAAVTTTSIK